MTPPTLTSKTTWSATSTSSMAPGGTSVRLATRTKEDPASPAAMPAGGVAGSPESDRSVIDPLVDHGSITGRAVVHLIDDRDDWLAAVAGDQRRADGAGRQVGVRRLVERLRVACGNEGGLEDRCA